VNDSEQLQPVQVNALEVVHPRNREDVEGERCLKVVHGYQLQVIEGEGLLEEVESDLNAEDEVNEPVDLYHAGVLIVPASILTEGHILILEDQDEGSYNQGVDYQHRNQEVPHEAEGAFAVY